MTREQSALETKLKIRKAKTGIEIGEAIRNHFRAFQDFKQKEEHPLEDALSILNAPLFGLEG